jgi:hypothetical protein
VGLGLDRMGLGSHFARMGGGLGGLTKTMAYNAKRGLIAPLCFLIAILLAIPQCIYHCR